MNTEQGRFTSAARAARYGVPRGVRRDEGRVFVAVALVQGACLAVQFQAQNLAWGGIIAMVVNIAALIIVVGAGQLLTRVQGVHPRGHERRRRTAMWFTVLVVLLAGPWWMLHPHHSSAWLTTPVALVAVLPTLLLGASMIRTGR